MDGGFAMDQAPEHQELEVFYKEVDKSRNSSSKEVWFSAQNIFNIWT